VEPDSLERQELNVSHRCVRHVCADHGLTLCECACFRGGKQVESVWCPGVPFCCPDFQGVVANPYKLNLSQESMDDLLPTYSGEMWLGR
jgi:hypothetical protein